MLGIIRTHLKGYGRQAAAGPVFMVLEVICEMLMPLLMAEIVDTAIPQGETSYIFKLGGAMAVLALLSMLCGVMGAKLGINAAQGFGANLRLALFEKIQTFSFADIDRFSSASLITRTTNDVNNMTTMLTMGLRIMVRSPVMLLTALVIAIRLNARLALVLVVVIPVMVVIIAFVVAMGVKLFGLVQKRVDAINEVLQENLVAIRVVKAFVRQDYERGKFQKRNDQLTDAFLQVGLRIVAIMPVMTICMNAAAVAILYFGGKMIMGLEFDLGSLQAFISYVAQILMNVMMVAMSLLQLSRAQASARRINEVLNATPDIQDADQTAALPQPQGKVEFRDVSFRYASGAGDDVLAHIDLTVEPGSFVAIVGGTGVGKSSLVNLIPRFYDATGGQVLLDGVNVKDYPLEELRSRIGMVLQNNVLFSGTVRENLLWGKADATEEELIQAAKDAQAYGFILSLPQGFDTHLEQGGVNLSGGQKQRLCIARAMLRKPAVLILDDSTSAVDSATEAAIRDSFAKNLKDTTVIIIAQRISSVRYADEIVILEDDHIAGRGTHDALLASNPIYQEIYQSQQEGVSQ